MAQSVGAVALDIVAGKNTLNSTLKSSMSEAQNTVNSGSSGISKALGGIGSVAKTVGKTVAVGIGVASTAVVAMGKSAILAYADYEQLVGGVETLFKDSASTVIENASKAYQTAGLSANEYMETVTSFSASLLQSLGNDTVKASEKADMAITDMSDNANKMGSDLETLKTAYAGFAKGQFMLLDNLKLGYGGTATEMQRLLNDAQKISGIKYDISSYADIVDAIHVVQTEMGITGTTAKEASTTISGSLASMKSAWQNVLTGMGDDTADFGSLIDQFVSSVSTVGENLLPRIEIVLGGVVKLVQGLAPKIISVIPSLLSQLLPSVINTAVSLIQEIAVILPDLINMLVTTAIPALISGAILVINSLVQLLPDIIQPIVDNLPMILENLITAVLSNLPIFIQGLIDLVVALIPMIPEILNILLDSVLLVFTEQWASIVIQLIPVLILGAVEMTVALVKALPSLLLAIVKVIGEPFILAFSAIKGIFSIDAVSSIFNSVKNTISNIFNNARDVMVRPIEKARDLIKGIIDNIKGFFSNMKLKFPNISLPHFSIKPSGWQIGDLLKGKIPSLGISWYSKAMNNPMIMNKPTIFGYDAGTGNLLGGGEAGSELVVGTNTLLSMIKSAVASVLGGSKLTIEVPALQNVRTGGAGSDNGLSDKIDGLIELFKQFIEYGDSNMTVPIYIGNELIDEYILNKNNRNVLRSGGHA